MKNKIKLISAFILGVLITSVTVYAITINSGNVSFIPEDSDWEVSNVNQALNNLNETVNGIKNISC